MASNTHKLSVIGAPMFLPVPPGELERLCLGDRQWFFKLINLEECYPLLESVWKRMTTFLDKQAGVQTFVTNQAFDALLAGTMGSGAMLRPQTSLSDPALLTTDKHWRYFYHQYGPLFKVLGCWLTGTTSITYAWRMEGGVLLRAHARMVGHGYPLRSQAHLFEQAARQVDVNFTEVFASSFSNNLQIQEYAFALPVFLLSIARFPGSLYAETLGVNLAMSLYVDALNAMCHTETAVFGLRSPDSYRDLAVDAIQHYIGQAGHSEKTAIATGYASTITLIDAFERKLATELAEENRFSSEAAMVALIDKLGRHGCGYHRRGVLADRPIDQWLDPETFCAESTVRALADSRYVSAGQPNKSALLKIISHPKGSMFGVFSEQDIEVVQAWIAELESTRASPQAIQDPPKEPVDQDRPSLCEKLLTMVNNQALNKYAGHTLKQLYPLFLSADRTPDVLPAARQFAAKWIATHRRSVLRAGLPFSPYSHEKLDHWLAYQHTRQVSSYRPLTDAPQESREEIIADAVKLAPLTLIDGAWLRNVSIPSMVTTHIGALQYRTLIDELGRGNSELHHGNIYQGLLASMGVSVGNFTESQFAASELFDEDCLKVPVFWLAVSLFPQSFQPETLGLNLAMELSGVGGEYRRSADVLRHYGFSSMFTDLHNTIDNVVSGHTAWAIEAIKQHLDDILQKGGEQELAKHWERVWVGYCSLTPPDEPWFAAMSTVLQRTFNKLTQRQDAS